MALPAPVKTALKERFGEHVRFDEPMAAHTSLRVGGPADALVMPGAIDDLTGLIRMLTAEGIDWLILGGGTNLLVRDKGIRGVVISLSRGFRGIRVQAENPEYSLVVAGAGAKLSALCRYAAENGLSGMEFAVGIPGSIGGAIMMNAGTAIGEMESAIADITILYPPERVETIRRDRLSFAYRGIQWQCAEAGTGTHPIILETTLRLGHADTETLRQRDAELIARRKTIQPAGLSAGCFFKNPAQGPSAGELIDRAGLKGYAQGDAVVSEKHANFLLNRGNASAADMLRLMAVVQERVSGTFNIQIEPEIKIVGQL